VLNELIRYLSRLFAGRGLSNAVLRGLALTICGVSLCSLSGSLPQLVAQIVERAQPTKKVRLLAAASDQFASLTKRRSRVELAVRRIGQVSIRSEAKAADAPPVPVHRFESLLVEILNSLPRGAHIYTAVRQNGGHWEVGDGIERPGANTAFRLACRFGSQEDDLALFDLRVFAHRENLPRGPVPDVLLSNSGVLAISPIFRVQRVSTNRPTLAVTQVGHEEIWDTSTPWVYDESAVHIYATKLPIGARIGLVVRPTRPLNNYRWVQTDELEAPGDIDSYWGDPGYHAFVRFSVTAFVVESEADFPPRGVPISAAEWASYTAKFLSVSQPVTVVKAGDHFTVEEVNNRRLPPGGRAIAEPQADIRGLLDRPIASGERIWLVCAPGDGTGAKPWVAGATTDGVDNAWTAKAVQLWTRGQPSTFDLLAVLTSDDPNRIDPKQLRDWVNLHKHAVNTVTLQIGGARGR
jgi:hypothetical protein